MGWSLYVQRDLKYGTTITSSPPGFKMRYNSSITFSGVINVPNNYPYKFRNTRSFKWIWKRSKL